MCHILILLQHVQRARFFSFILFCFSLFIFVFFLDQHYNPTYLTSHHHTTHLMAYVLFFCCKIILKNENKKNKKSLLQVVQLSVLAVQAAAGGHLSKYITVI